MIGLKIRLKRAPRRFNFYLEYSTERSRSAVKLFT